MPIGNLLEMRDNFKDGSSTNKKKSGWEQVGRWREQFDLVWELLNDNKY